jgi:tRNA-binding EMAP/Myf-like protein
MIARLVFVREVWEYCGWRSIFSSGMLLAWKSDGEPKKSGPLTIALGNEPEIPVPKFIDFHPNLQVSAEGIAQLREDTKSGKVDEFGVRQLELIDSPDGKGVYSVLEAPDEDAVRKHHGGSCGEVIKVESLL